MSRVFRASFSVLDAWDKKQYDRAVEMYFKLSGYTSEAMADGKYHHEQWQQHIDATSTLPECFGSEKLYRPATELKLTAKLNSGLEVVGVIDCLAAPTIHEFKTGKKSSYQYAKSMQMKVYGVLCILNDIFVDKGILWRHDFVANKSDMSIVWLTDEAIEEAVNWIETLGGEMHHYLEKNGLYEQLGGNLPITTPHV